MKSEIINFVESHLLFIVNSNVTLWLNIIRLPNYISQNQRFHLNWHTNPCTLIIIGTYSMLFRLEIESVFDEMRLKLIGIEYNLYTINREVRRHLAMKKWWNDCRHFQESPFSFI